MPLRILLADDSMTAQNMGKKILTDAGHEVIAVSNGAAAAKKLGERFDLIILDVFMPGYTGLEICEKVRASAESAKTPVLLTVGKMEPYNAQDGQRVKADGVIIKPFEATDLLAAVGRIEKKAAEMAKKPDYEKTMVLNAATMKAFQEDETYSSWKVVAPAQKEEQEEEEMPVAPPPMPVGDPGTPAFSMDDSSTFSTASGSAASSSAASSSTALSGAAAAPAMQVSHTPSFEIPSAAPAFSMEDSAPAASFEMPSAPTSGFDMSAPAQEMNIPSSAMQTFNIDETMQMPPAAAPVFSMDFAAPSAEVYAAPAFSLPEVEAASAPTMAEMMEPTAHDTSNVPMQSTPAPEVEFTAAPKVGAIEVQTDPSLDMHHEDAGSGMIAMGGADPALVTDPHEMTTEFATKFGVENDSDPVVVGTAAGYAEAMQGEGDGEENGPGDTESADAEFEARLAAAMSSYEAPVEESAGAVGMEETQPEELPAIPHYAPYETTPETAEAGTAPSHEVEEVVAASADAPAASVAEAEVQSTTPAEAIVEEPVDVDASTLPPPGMVDASLVEQMQEAVSEMQVQEHREEAHAEPVAIPAIAAVLDNNRHDLELASALAAAVGGEQPQRAPAAMAAAAGSTLDAVALSGVVNKVLEKMLPMILSQIAAEIEQIKK